MSSICLKVVFLIILYFKPILTSTSLKLVTPQDCSSHEFYDKSHLRCVPCGMDFDIQINGKNSLNKQRNQTNNYQSWTKKVDGYECECSKGSFKSLVSDEQVCKACPPGFVTSLDGYSCAECEPPEIFDNSTNTCQCPTGHLVESIQPSGNLTQLCKSCPGIMQTGPDGQSCVPCHESFIREDRICSCPKDRFKIEGGVCIPNYDIIPEKQDLYTVWFGSEEVRSLFFADNLQAAAFNCNSGRKNRTACQMLGNLCVLLHYSFYENFNLNEVNACTEYRKLITKHSSSLNQQIWPENSPWLYYLTDSKAELFKTNVPNRFTINSKLRIIAFRYNAFGHLTEVSELNPREIQVCEESHKKSFSGFTFGSNYYKECTLSATELWERSPKTGQELIFYDLYLLNDKDGTIYPIPVLNKELKKNTDLINLGSIDEWQLVRRFFVKEALSSIEAGQTSNVESSSFGQAKFLRYMKTFELDINLKESDGSGSIYPPAIYISYGELSQEDRKRGTDVKVTFSISYWMSQAPTERNISISLSVFCSLAVVYGMFRTWIWNKRSGSEGIDPMVVAKFLFITSGILANVFFWINVWSAIYWFIVFKYQSVLHILLPTPSQEYFLHVYLFTAAILKTVQVLSELAVTARVDIFFIDWERPKTRHQWLKLMNQSKVKTDTNGDEKSSDEKVVTKRKNSNGNQNGQKKSNGNDVSIWRTFFVANEWIELYSYRRLNVQWHIFLVILVTNVMGFENLTTYDTRTHLTLTEAQEHVPTSVTCRVAVAVIVFRVLAWIQMVYKSVIYEKYVKDKLQEFVDLCSVSNVSVFVWVCQRYGFYIHGRSPNGKADVGMKEMHEQLKREEDDLCSKRGLVPNTDQQTFEFLIPSTINDQYNRLRSMLTAFSHGADRMQGVGNQISRIDIDKVVPTYLSINKFLSAFIEHTFKEFDYTVKEKTTAECIADLEFDEPRDRGFFYTDSDCSFKLAMFYGMDETLISFECMVFVAVDLIFENFTLAAVITFLVAHVSVLDAQFKLLTSRQIIRLVFVALAKGNLSRKGLVDERFLI